MYTAFMTDEEKVWWSERLTKAHTGMYTPPGLGDTILMPSVNGGALFFSGMLIMAFNVWMTIRREKPQPVAVLPAHETAPVSGAVT